jgi:hypothetical protein
VSRTEGPSHELIRWLFLRGLGVIYLIAFLSLWVQVLGLIGSHGILPVQQLMGGANEYFNAHQVGWERYRALPTLAWLSGSDAFVTLQCAAGAGLAALLILDVAPGLCLALLWALYLSLVTIGQDFFSFQWDNLLLETGFLAVFFAPWRWATRPPREPPPSRLVLWLFRWLLFRLMFESGCVKLLSGDPSWRHLTALTVHYQTQPLPTWVGWYVHQLPARAHEVCCIFVFLIEIGVPFLVLAPRRLRLAACAALVALQTLILLTGNYAFFNWLTLALCLLLLDDQAVAKVLPAALRARFAPGLRQSPPIEGRPRWGRVVAAPLAAGVVAVSSIQLLAMFGFSSAWFAPAVLAENWLAPFRSVNNYGLFAVMTTSRPEIIVEGSTDGITWLPYEFAHKPGNVARRPDFVAPYQPRLDWQMWFAALGRREDNPWFTNFCVRLLEGSPSVLALLAQNPFPERPPRYVRAVVYDYRFTTVAERRATGSWWTRTLMGDYLSPISLPPS